MMISKSFYTSFELDLTTKCNLKCPLCTRNYKHAQHTIRSGLITGRPLCDIIKQLDMFPNLTNCMLAGAISEPTLYKDLFGFINYLNSRNIRIEMYTNGSVHDENYWYELGCILKYNDEVHFTICGSTQELHEKYRVGSDLGVVIRNAMSLKKAKPIDKCQYIEFEYNKDDFKSEQTKRIMSMFSDNYSVHSEGRRFLNEKITTTDITPTTKINNVINTIFEKWGYDKNDNIICNSLIESKIFISASGEYYPCYIAYEYGIKILEVDGEFDYTDIIKFKYNECFLCTKRVRNLIEKTGLDFIC